MLNKSLVLNYVKKRLGFPYTIIELSDEDIMEYINLYTIPIFSKYFPYKKWMSLNLGSSDYRHPLLENEYFLNDDENLDIISIVDIIFPDENQFFHGHPVYGPLSLRGIEQFALDVANSQMLKSMSNYNYTFEFIHPNRVRIIPTRDFESEYFVTVEYETVQPPDFRGIKLETQSLFLDLCLADTKLQIAEIRKKYGESLQTPFGQIPLGVDMASEANELRDRTIEKLELGSFPNIIFDKG